MAGSDPITGDELELALTRQSSAIAAAFESAVDRILPEIRSWGTKRNNSSAPMRERDNTALGLFGISVTMILGLAGLIAFVVGATGDMIQIERESRVAMDKANDSASAARHRALSQLMGQNRDEVNQQLARLEAINDNRLIGLDTAIASRVFAVPIEVLTPRPLE